MAILLAFPLLGILVMLQTVVASRLPLLYGTADLVLLALTAWGLQERVETAWIWAFIGGVMVSFVSGLPFFTPLIGYLLVTALTRYLRRRVWQTPILVMFLATFVGTLILHGLSLAALELAGDPYPLGESLRLITLPSALLNLLLALPVYAFINDIARWLYPVEVEI
ncbi:MAG: rod shape-determining protein MreD [Chloroflexi bacterium]|nr:rod shape-determining protein MreD [Chloroflexota bacterium]